MPFKPGDRVTHQVLRPGRTGIVQLPEYQGAVVVLWERADYNTIHAAEYLNYAVRVSSTPIRAQIP